MDKNFSKGLLIGTVVAVVGGLVLILILVFSLLAPWGFERGPEAASGKGKAEEHVIFRVPPTRQRYLGAYHDICYIRLEIPYGIPYKGISLLDPGDGRIEGAAYVNGVPVKGLRLRLVVNGAAYYTEWATTDELGRYVIRVPTGDYAINGFQLDSDSADDLLGGKINDPSVPCDIEPTKVTPERPGTGFTFRFVDPVALDGVKRRYKLGEEIVFTWAHYPGAAVYRLSMNKRVQRGGSAYWHPVFLMRPWILETDLTRVSLAEEGISLSPATYQVEIHALNKAGKVISQSLKREFEVVPD